MFQVDLVAALLRITTRPEHIFLNSWAITLETHIFLYKKTGHRLRQSTEGLGSFMATAYERSIHELQHSDI